MAASPSPLRAGVPVAWVATHALPVIELVRLLRRCVAANPTLRGADETETAGGDEAGGALGLGLGLGLGSGLGLGLGLGLRLGLVLGLGLGLVLGLGFGFGLGVVGLAAEARPPLRYRSTAD